MNERIKELLALLDMPESEQVKFLELRGNENNQLMDLERSNGQPLDLDEAKCALLAFRLRDEIAAKGKCYIQEYRSAKLNIAKVACAEWKYDWGVFDALAWWEMNAQPIHWIVAALIAKELEKDHE